VVDQAVRRWVQEVLRNRSDLLRVGYFGSYARGDWGVGSDLDLIIVVKDSTQPFERRAAEWDTTELPVPADLLIYTQDEWHSLRRQGRFYQILIREAIWSYVKPWRS
jgi:predicted nucleotidyltransferase